MRVLGVDFGTTFGWCFMDELERMDVGRKVLTGDEGERYAAFRVWLVGALDRLGDRGMVAFEEVRFNRGTSYIPGQTAILQAECVARDIPYLGVGVSELKKFATGNGNAGKPEMVAAAEGWISRTPTHDEADAILVARWAVENALVEGAA